MSEVSMEDAYAEACQALGESMVVQRMLGKQIRQLAEQNERLVGMQKADAASND